MSRLQDIKLPRLSVVQLRPFAAVSVYLLSPDLKGPGSNLTHTRLHSPSPTEKAHPQRI
jgi:hypothetical protein